MRLVTPQEVLDRASLNVSGTGPTTTVGNVLEGVTDIVENLLDCSLLTNTRLDVFSYSIPKFRSAFAPFKFYLSSGFLDATIQPVEIRYSIDGSMLTASGEGSVLDPSIYVVDEKRGHVEFFQDITEGSGGISIYYGNGFAAKDGIFQGIPSWLKNAAISVAIRMTEAHSVGSRRKDAVAVKNELATHVAMQINNHYRRAYDVKYSMRTVVD